MKMINILFKEGRSAGITQLIITSELNEKPLLHKDAEILARKINQGLSLTKIVEDKLAELKKIKKDHPYNWNMHIEPKYKDLKKLLDRSKKW